MFPETRSCYLEVTDPKFEKWVVEMEVSDLYESLKKDVDRFAYSIARHEQEGKDLVQDAWEKSLKEDDLLDLPRHKQKAWFYRVMKNKLIDLRRKDQRLSQWEEQMDLPVHDFPYQHLEMTELLSHLSEELSDIVFKRYWIGLSSKEIGQQLGLPLRRFGSSFSFRSSNYENIWRRRNDETTNWKYWKVKFNACHRGKCEGDERVNNIGTVYYRKETAHLLPLLNAGNIGSCQEIPDGYHFTKGTLFVDSEYLKSITEPLELFATNDVVIDEEVTAEQLKQSQLQLRVNGQVYTPAHLAGAAAGFIAEGTSELKTYEGAQFRFEKGEFRLTNAFLKTATKPIYLVVKGIVHFAPDLDMELFHDKLYRLDVKGVLSLYESQEPFFHQKAGSLIGSQIEVIPDGYQVIEQTLRLNSRSIRRFRGGKLYTTAPILIDADVTRAALSEALHSIHSHSIVVCHEDVEDLIYECAPLPETEVLSIRIPSFLSKTKNYGPTIS